MAVEVVDVAVLTSVAVTGAAGMPVGVAIGAVVTGIVAFWVGSEVAVCGGTEGTVGVVGGEVAACGGVGVTVGGVAIPANRAGLPVIPARVVVFCKP